MSTPKEPSNRPSHRVYAITKRNDKSIWTAIGAAWPHGDGKGFNVKLEYLPLNGAEIALRIPEPRTEAEQDTTGEGDAA